MTREYCQVNKRHTIQTKVDEMVLQGRRSTTVSLHKSIISVFYSEKLFKF